MAGQNLACLCKKRISKDQITSLFTTTPSSNYILLDFLYHHKKTKQNCVFALTLLAWPGIKPTTLLILVLSLGDFDHSTTLDEIYGGGEHGIIFKKNCCKKSSMRCSSWKLIQEGKEQVYSLIKSLINCDIY